MENSPNITDSEIAFTPDDSIRYLFGLKPKVIHEEYTLSDYPVDILPFDNIFFETVIAQGMIFKGKRSSIVHNWTLTVDPGYKYVERFAGCNNCYIMNPKDFISKSSFKLKNENNELVSLSGQSITFRLSNREI